MIAKKPQTKPIRKQLVRKLRPKQA